MKAKTLELMGNQIPRDERYVRETKHVSEQMRKAMTISEAMPLLTQIANEHGLNLNIGLEYKEAVRIMTLPR